MAKNLEGNLIDANGKYINFDAHREEYTQHYDALRKELYSQWRSNKVLDKILKGHTLGGSYGDNLKVAMPNEFDLVIHLVFPENDKIIVKADPRKPGNVTLDMTKVMEIIGKQDHNKPVFEQLQKMVNRNQLLCEDKLQSWLQGVMTTTLNKMDKQIKVGSVVSPLSYKKSGPAHTIDVKGRYVYSVDFVPAIRLKAAQCVLGPEQKRHFGTTPHWDAIPKPMKPAQPENISFRASYYEAEKGLLQDKHNLKNSIRLMKRLRDTKNNMANLKSYYIKTLFLWEVTKQDSKYWQKPMYEIVTEMLDRLSNTLKLTSSKGKLLFFWDPKLDMFAELTDRQRQDMFNCVSKTQYLFRRGDGNLTVDIEKNILNYFNNPGRGIENIPDNSQCKGNGTKPKDPTKQNNPQPAQKNSKAAKSSQEAVKDVQPNQAAPGQPKKQDAKQPINPNRKPSEPQPPPEGKKEESSCSIN